MADRDVIQALRAIKALALQHHGDEPPATLLHALLVEIPAECDSAIAALDAADARPADSDIWQHDETGRIVELPAGSPSPGKRYFRVRGMGGRVSVVGEGDEARVVFTPDARPTPPAPVGSRCAKCGEPTDPWLDGDGGDERCRCTPTPPAPADDASGAEAMREAFLVETAARHAAQCVEYERRPVKADAMDKPMVERAVASALSEIRFVNGRGVSLASPGLRAIPLPPAPVDAVERDAARFRWLMERNFGFAFDAERCGISTGRWGRWPEEPDEQRAMIDRAIAAEASAVRDGKGG